MSLLEAAKQFERDVVIPHCRECRVPCCGLSEVVLELSFAQANALYGITKKQKTLPSAVRRRGSVYYAHGSPCPAYTQDKRCGIYEKRPTSCAEFPVYADDDAVTADLRCEALRDNLDDLRARLKKIDPDLREEADDEFDCFVSFVAGSP